MNHQTILAEKQLEIVEKQDELLARRAELTVFARVRSPDPDGERVFEFRVQNNGKRTAPWYYWNLYVPFEVRGYTMQFTEEKGKDAGTRVDRTDNNRRYLRYDDYVKYPMAPKRSGVIAVMRVKKQKAFMMGWQVVSEDGAFPGGDEYGSVEISTD